jgi:hypothetical protein
MSHVLVWELVTLQGPAIPKLAGATILLQTLEVLVMMAQILQ